MTTKKLDLSMCETLDYIVRRHCKKNEPTFKYMRFVGCRKASDYMDVSKDTERLENMYFAVYTHKNHTVHTTDSGEFLNSADDLDDSADVSIFEVVFWPDWICCAYDGSAHAYTYDGVPMAYGLNLGWATRTPEILENVINDVLAEN